MINPMKLMKIKNAWSRFAANHPKFPLFLNAIVKKGIQEETIFEFKVTYPDGQQLVTNMRLRAEDIELWKGGRKDKPEPRSERHRCSR